MVKHILFDCDGVLIDTEIVAAEIVTIWLNSESVAIDIEEYISNYTGKTFTDIVTSLKAEKRLREDLNLSEVIPVLDDKIRENQKPIDGVWEMLDALTLPRSVVSNSAKDYVELALDKLKIEHHFEGRVFSAEMVEKGKPSPDLYHFALSKIDHSEKDVVVIEDSVAGVTAATAAGLHTIGYMGGSHVRNGLADALKNAGAQELVGNHNELTQRLREL